LVGDLAQPVAAAAAGLDAVAARAQGIDALEQLRAGHVELAAEHGAADEIVGALEEQPEHDGVLVEIGPMALAACERRRGGVGAHRLPPQSVMSRLRSQAGAECVSAPTET